MTLFVFLPAAARAGIVAAHFRLVAPHGLDDGVVAADARRLAVGSGDGRGHGGSSGAGKRRHRFVSRAAQNQGRALTGRGAPRRRHLAFVAEHRLADRCQLLFSPSWGQLEPRPLAEWILADRLPVRLQLQLHKLLWGEEAGR